MNELPPYHRTLRAMREWLLPTGTRRHRVYCALLHPLRSRPKLESAAELRSRLRRSRLAFAETAEPEVSVVVAMYGQASVTLDCLLALRAQEAGCALEVILIDDASPGDVGSLFQQVRGLHYQRNSANLGYLRSCNKASLSARGRYLLLLNNDARPEAGAIASLLRVFRERPDVGAVGAKLLYPDGTLQEAGALVYPDGRAAKRGQGLDAGAPEFCALQEADYCSGAALMIERDVFYAIGGYDELYLPSHYEDVDLAFELRQRGLKVYYQPEARFIHLEGATCGPSGPLNHTDSNRPKFLAKWAVALASGAYPSARRA